jgi:anti-sigma regulatory factor (Ser/Thr protein kinase)
MASQFERRLGNDFDELAGVAEEVRAHLARHGVEPRIVYAVDLALEELVGNTIRYGCDDGGAHAIEVRVNVDQELVSVTIADDGRPFDPTDVPEPPRPTTLAETPVGGRGIAMVRALIEDVRYHRAERRNVLELRLPRTRA